MTAYPAPPRAALAGFGRIIPARRINGLIGLSTIVILAGLLLASVAILYGETALQVFALAAPVVGAALATSFAIEARASLRNLVRVDLFMLAVLYLLTFFEFLFPQNEITERVTVDAAQTAVTATLVAFAGIVIGRHAFPVKVPLASTIRFQVSPRATILLMIGCAFLGYLYILLAVNFDIFEMLYQMQRPRFTQPWTRGRLGGFSTLLNEFSLLSYLLPPLSASVFVQRRRFTLVQQAIALVLLALVLFDSFAGGTRNAFLTHVVTFSVTFALLMPRLSIARLATLAAPALTVIWLAIYYLPEIRTVGLANFELENARTDRLFVDLNLVNIAILTQAFPERANYLGLEIPFTAAIRPIPRALWPGKPEGLSISIEQVIGVTGMTLAATFIGELWMAGGLTGVAIASLCFGAAAARWNRVGASASTNMKLILFAAGFFPAGICMRSFLSVAPPFLPLLALGIFLKASRRSMTSHRPSRKHT